MFKITDGITKGAERWLSFKRYGSSREFVQKCRQRPHLKILVADPSPEGKRVEDLSLRDFEEVVVLFGNETRGVSEILKHECDEKVRLSQKGFVESFNLSNSCSLMSVLFSLYPFCSAFLAEKKVFFLGKDQQDSGTQ